MVMENKKEMFWVWSFPFHAFFYFFLFFVSLQSTIVFLSTVKLSDRSFFQLFFTCEWWGAVSSKWTAISCWIITVEQRFQKLSQIIVWVLLAACCCSLTAEPTLGSPHPSPGGFLGFGIALEGLPEPRWGMRDLQEFVSPFREAALMFPSLGSLFLHMLKIFTQKREFQAAFGACSQKKTRPWFSVLSS